MNKEMWNKLLRENTIIESAKSADEAYKQRLKEIDKLMKEVPKILKSHASKQKQDIKNWGYVGDLSYFVENMKELVDILK